ncbi:hypothetical protein BDZ89DRAFT_1066407 [Hymenopellis radicata]|nr:hypothetical protein BDZ89DRAFT_1066407 [Hymenopellis radicata]
MDSAPHGYTARSSKIAAQGHLNSGWRWSSGAGPYMHYPRRNTSLNIRWYSQAL